MKGYFSKLMQRTGLSFEPGAEGVSNSLSPESTAHASRGSREEMAPLEVEAITFADSRAPVTAGESPGNVAGINSADESNESAVPNRSFDSSVRTTNNASRSRSSVDSFQRTNEAAPVTEGHPRANFEAVKTNFTITKSGEVEPQAFSRAGRPTAAVRQIIHSSEGPTLEKKNFSRDAPPQTPDTLIEILPRASPGESRIRFEYSDSNSSQPRAPSIEPSLEPSLEPRSVEFLEEQSPIPRTFARTELVERVAGLESQFAAPVSDTLIEVSPRASPDEPRMRFEDSDSSTSQPRTARTELVKKLAGLESQFSAPESPRHDGRNQVGRRPDADGQELVRPVTEAAHPAPASGKRSEQEAAIHNYMKEVRAWVAASPTDEGTLEQDDWSNVRAELGNVFSFEPETNAASDSGHELSADPGVNDLSLFIGNISIVIEEPQKTAPPPATPPPTERSPVETASEPTSLSRYYLRPW